MASTVGTDGGGSAVRPATAPRYRTRTDESEAGYGWVSFAGIMLLTVGSLNAIYGIAAIGDSRFYVRDVTYIISDLNTWGWFLLLLGVVQFVSAFGILFQTAGARWVGILSAAGNMIIQFFVLPGAPLLAIALIAMDVLVIYGLIAHGRRTEAA
jgi:hypothetical protein